MMKDDLKMWRLMRRRRLNDSDEWAFEKIWPRWKGWRFTYDLDRR